MGHVDDETISISMIDWFHSGGDGHLNTASYAFNSWCSANYGFDNSVMVFTLNAGTGAFQDASAFFIVP
jgi:hypothetical protein